MLRLFHPRLFGWCLKLAIFLMVICFFKQLGTAVGAEAENFLMGIGQVVENIQEQIAPITQILGNIAGALGG